MSDTRNQVYHNQDLHFKGNVFDCKFYNCRVTIDKPYQAFKCEFHTPRTIAANVTDCYVEMGSMKFSNYTACVTYASGPGNDCIHDCENVTINRPVKTSTKKTTTTTGTATNKSSDPVDSLVSSLFTSSSSSADPITNLVSSLLSNNPNVSHMVTSTGGHVFCSGGGICLNGNEGMVGGQEVVRTVSGNWVRKSYKKSSPSTSPVLKKKL